ncbi:MAG: NUDIX domain-containing protein [Clostridiales bacterium]|nr:NUDIX domain-containing protein [Clostridiales bacterium]
MSKVVGTKLIIKDDFNNVLILKRKVKRGQPESWCLIGSAVKGKETLEKCVNRAAKDTIKALVFDLEELGEYEIDNDTKEKVLVYLGNIKEKPMLDKNYVDTMWISKRNLSEYNLEDYEKNLLIKYVFVK